MEDFLKGSKTFMGIDFIGNYTMPLSHFFKIYDHYKNTGENLLDDYSECVYLSWDIKEECSFDLDSFIRKSNSISKIRHLRLGTDFLLDAIMSLNKGYYNYRTNQRKLINKPRIEACKHTSKKDIRDEVFKLYGKICLRCGSEENISIDHVIPVCKGGKNSIKNYQPLCKSCNSKKGIETFDYR